MPDGAVGVNFGAGRASLDVVNLEVEDDHDVVNALLDGPSKEAVASFHVRWGGTVKRVKIRDPKAGFAGDFIENSATIEWSARVEDGVTYRSDAASTSTSAFAEIGHERNGRFFPQGG